MADYSDEDKRLGAKKRHITWVDRLKTSMQPKQDQAQYLQDIVNRKDDEEKARAQGAKRKPGPGI